ncbi:hypothetical protein [Prosthecobacter sp.]|uniref:hypothetical protein n=1 Tax=Prosthecobacter sp. TaxID=1965333 RepID=UPI0024888831|nr:hypothetical protein [Prosthecobacter sp.]MDI1313815.1 hypothetical protein [Prosthecobacter sp.]
MKKPTSRSTLLFILLVTLVPAALVYLAAKVHAERQLQQHEERISQEGKVAIAHVVKLNELRLTMPGKTPQEITALVFPPLPPGYTLRPVTAADRAAHPALKDSDYLVQQNVPPHLVIPSAAPPLHLDLPSSAAETPPAAQPVK